MCFEYDVLEIQDFLEKKEGSFWFLVPTKFHNKFQNKFHWLCWFAQRCRQDMKMKTMAILTMTWYHVMKVRFPPPWDWTKCRMCKLDISIYNTHHQWPIRMVLFRRKIDLLNAYELWLGACMHTSCTHAQCSNIWRIHIMICCPSAAAIFLGHIHIWTTWI